MAKTYFETESGFRYKFVRDFDDDFEIVELFRQFLDNNLMIIDLTKKLIGEEGYERLKEHCKVDGRISAQKMDAEMTEIITKNPYLKK